MLIESEDVVDSFGVSVKSKIEPSRFDRYVVAAVYKLKSWVSESVWADANLATPTNQDAGEILKAAAIELTMYFALPNLHTYLTENGVIQTAQSEGNTVLRYLSPKEIVEKQTSHWNTAKEMVSDYLAVIDANNDGIPDTREFTSSVVRVANGW